MVDAFFAAVNLSAAAYCYASIVKFVHFQLLAKISIVQICDYIKNSGIPLILVFGLPRMHVNCSAYATFFMSRLYAVTAPLTEQVF